MRQALRQLVLDSICGLPPAVQRGEGRVRIMGGWRAASYGDGAAATSSDDAPDRLVGRGCSLASRSAVLGRDATPWLAGEKGANADFSHDSTRNRDNLLQPPRAGSRFPGCRAPSSGPIEAVERAIVGLAQRGRVCPGSASDRSAPGRTNRAEPMTPATDPDVGPRTGSRPGSRTDRAAQRRVCPEPRAGPGSQHAVRSSGTRRRGTGPQSAAEA